MSRTRRITLAIAALALVASAFAPASAARRSATPLAEAARTARWHKAALGLRAPTRELIVAFEAGAGAETRAALHARAGARALDRIPGRRLVLVRVPTRADVDRAMRRYEASDAVAYVEPNFPRPLLETVPTDPLFVEEWGLRNTGQAHGIADPPPATAAGIADADLDASDAWDTTVGAATTVVAVIDSGVDTTHPDLAPSLWVNPDEIPANGVDDDANGFVDDLNGWDFIDGDAVPQDLDDHGTHVAGTVAAAMDGQGVVGVCPGCRIMALRFDLDVFTEVQALDYAIANGASVVNGSFGGGFFSKTERKALQRAIDAGILLVFAAGNDAANQDMFLAGPGGNQVAPSYPAAHDLAGIVSVAASNHNDEFGSQTGCDIQTGGDPICDFSNLGHDSVDLAAPGVDVLSTIPGNTYTWLDGTSMAAPHVAGVAGLVKSLHPTYTPLELRNALLNSVDLPAPLGGGFILTDGRVNAATALNASTATTFPTSIGNISTASGINKKKTGRLSYPSNVNDVFRKSLHKGDRYVVTLEVPKGKDFDLFIYKPGTLGIFQITGIVGFGARGKGKDEVVVLTARKNGVYYFQASSFFSTGRYVLRVDRA